MSEFPPGWATATLREVGAWVGGGTPSKRVPAYWSGEIPWVSPKDMKVERLSDAGDHISEEAVRHSATRVVPAGSVLVVTRSGILRHTLPVAVAERSVALNQDLKACIPAGGIDGAYLAWTLRARAREILSTCSKAGTTVANVETERLLDQAVPIAPSGEQRRIVLAIEEQLSRLEAAARTLEEVPGRVRGLRDRAIEIAFDPAWPTAPLGDIADVVGGVTKDSKRESDPALVEVPYLRVANVQRGHLDLANVATIRVRPETAAALQLRPGDVLFNEGGDRDKLGRGWVWAGEIDGCIHQNHVFRARLRKEFDPKFVSHYGNTFGQRWFEANGRQTTNLASLSLSALRRFPVPAPTLEVQREVVAEIDRRLSAVDALTSSLDRGRRLSVSLRRAILERAFRGELAPQDPADEPATVLLERIRAERAAGAPAPRGRGRSSVRTPR